MPLYGRNYSCCIRGNKERSLYMIKKMLSVLVACFTAIACISTGYAEAPELEFSAIEYTYADGSAVSALKPETITASVNIKNNSNEAKRPVLVVMSYESGMLDGIWYEQADADIRPGTNADIHVSFAPASTGKNTVIKAAVLDSMKALNSKSKTAELLSGTTALDSLKINGTAVSGYSDTVNQYLYKTASAIGSIEAEPADGGQKIQIKYAEDFPGISNVIVTAPNGSKRTIKIIAYQNDSDIDELVPTVTTGSGNKWNGTPSTDENGRYVLTGEADAGTDRHFRYQYGGVPAYEIGGSRIMQIDLGITAVKYKPTKNNGKTLIDIRTDNGTMIYNTTALTTKMEEGKSYNIRMIFDKDRNVHVFMENEHIIIPLNKSADKTISSIVLAQSSPEEAGASNVVAFDKPVYSIYPSSYDIITNNGEVGYTEEMFTAAPSEPISLSESLDYSIDVIPSVLNNGGYASAKASVIYGTSGRDGATDEAAFDLSAMQQGKAETLKAHIYSNKTISVEFMGASATYTLPSNAVSYKGIRFTGYKGGDEYICGNEKLLKTETVYEYSMDEPVAAGRVAEGSAVLNVISYTQNEDYNTLTFAFAGRSESGAEVSGGEISIPMDGASSGGVYPISFSAGKDRKVKLNLMNQELTLTIPDGVKELTGIKLIGIKGSNEYSITDFDATVYSEKLIGITKPKFLGRDGNTEYITDNGVFEPRKEMVSTDGVYILKKKASSAENTMYLRAGAFDSETGFIRFSMKVTPFGEILRLNAKPNMLSVRITTNGKEILTSPYRLDIIMDLSTCEVRYYKDGVMTAKTVPGEGSEASNGSALTQFEMWIQSNADTCAGSNLLSFSEVKQCNYSADAGFEEIESEISAD